MVVSLIIDFFGAWLGCRISRATGVSAIGLLVIGLIGVLAGRVLFELSIGKT